MQQAAAFQPAPVFEPTPEPQAVAPAADLFEAPVRQQPAAAAEVPAPAYQPRPAPQQAARAAPPSIDADAGEFVAPRRSPAGTPSPEALARLRDAVSKTPAHQTRSAAPAAPAPQPVARTEEPARSRFGLGSLIGRMAGGSEPAAQPAPAAPAARVQPQPPAHAAYDDDQDPEQDRIEIPAFLRRQAN
jgi:cell division protein FtsZ